MAAWYVGTGPTSCLSGVVNCLQPYPADGDVELMSSDAESYGHSRQCLDELMTRRQSPATQHLGHRQLKLVSLPAFWRFSRQRSYASGKTGKIRGEFEWSEKGRGKIFLWKSQGKWKIGATRCQIFRLKCKFYFRRGSAPDPTGGAYSTHPDPLVALNIAP